eukprot:g30225.t1
MDSRVFLFDDLFDGEATDDEIFSSIQDELDAAVAGEAVCILAYGATGSGKTHTVTQLAQRAAGELERQALAMSSGGIKLEITVQLVEIYNDQLRDLLAEGAQPRLRVSVSSSGSALLGAVSQCISSDSAGGIAKMLGQVLRTGQAVVAALQRLYRGDASASAELEAFQSSAGALEVCVQLLQSTVPEEWNGKSGVGHMRYEGSVFWKAPVWAGSDQFFACRVGQPRGQNVLCSKALSQDCGASPASSPLGIKE